jgi:hypothetical protein
MSVEENKTVVRRFLEEAWNSGKPAAADDYIAASCVTRSGAAVGPLVKRGIARPSLEEQAGKARSIEVRLRREDEVIGRLDFDLAVTLWPGRGGHPTVRVARGKKEISGSGSGGAC